MGMRSKSPSSHPRPPPCCVSAHLIWLSFAIWGSVSSYICITVVTRETRSVTNRAHHTCQICSFSASRNSKPDCISFLRPTVSCSLNWTLSCSRFDSHCCYFGSVCRTYNLFFDLPLPFCCDSFLYIRNFVHRSVDHYQYSLNNWMLNCEFLRGIFLKSILLSYSKICNCFWICPAVEVSCLQCFACAG